MATVTEPSGVSDDSLGLLDDGPLSSQATEPSGGTDRQYADDQAGGGSTQGRGQPVPDDPPSSEGVTTPDAGGSGSQPMPDYSGLDTSLVASALSFGMQPEHVAAFRGSPQALQAALELRNRTMLGSMFPQHGAPQQAPWAAAQQPPFPPGMGGQFMPPAAGAGNQFGAQPNQSNTPGQAGFQLWKDDAEKQAYNDEFVALMERMNAHYAGQLSQMQQQLQSVGGFAQQTVASQRDAAVRAATLADHENFDRMIEGLGGDYETIFGRGTHDTIRPDSVYMSNRRAVHNAFSALRSAYAQQGLNPDPKTLLTSAAEHVLGQQWQFAQQQARSRGRAGQHTARPGRTSASPDRGDAAAMRFARQFLRERGADVGAPSSDGGDLGLL